MKKYVSYSIMSLILLCLLGLILFLQIPRISYKYDDKYDGYIITNVYGNSKEYNIPTTYKNKPVVSIGNKAFEKQTKLEKVIFENDSKITIISTNAFYNCTNLKEIIIPKSVVTIESNAFLGCSNLKAVTFEDDSKLELIGGSAFFDCKNLNKVILPIDIRYSIGDYCFYNTNIEELVISKKVISYDNSFYGVDEKNIIYK